MMVETKKNMEEKRDHLGKYWWVALVLFTLLSQGIMAFASCRYNRCGFPLDDAWIHQTYARNLVAMGDFYYREGVVSAGSTAPLWTFLLAIGYLIKQPFIWTYILGGALLAGVGILGELIYRCVSGRREAMPWMGLFLIGEWHLLWAAGSGMETILYVFLEFLLIYLLLFPEPKWLLMALVMGALVWTRPDGIAWLGPVALVAFFNPKYRLSRNSWFAFIPVFSLILALYVVFNHHLGGTWLPNTFNAKQAEYSTLLQEALISRYLRLIVMPWVGGAIFLVPGFLYSFFDAVASIVNVRKQERSRVDNHQVWILAMILWALGYVMIYALRLPVTYQHGRYLMPAMPVFYLVGWVGYARFIKEKLTFNRVEWLLSKVALFSGILVWAGFIILGARAFSEDVAIINTEMVDTAFWVNEHLDQDAIIAVHDIGAIGYYTSLRMIDLAGLISPDVIPIMRNEHALEEYLSDNGADYLIVFPGWYPELSRDLQIVYRSKGVFSLTAGGENMTVYLFSTPDQ